MKKINWRNAVEIRGIKTNSIRVVVYGGITVLDAKVAAVVAALQAKCPGLQAAPKATWELLRDSDRNMDCMVLTLLGDGPAAFRAIHQLKGLTA